MRVLFLLFFVGAALGAIDSPSGHAAARSHAPRAALPPEAQNAIVPAAADSMKADTGSAMDLDRRSDILEARAEIESASHARLELIGGWLGGIIGLFGVMITGVIVFFAFKTKEVAIFEAKKEIAGEKEAIEKMRAEAECVLGEIRVKLSEIEGYRSRATELTESLRETVAATLAGTPPTQVGKKKELAKAAEAIKSEPVSNLSKDHLRLLVAQAMVEKNYERVIELTTIIISQYRDDASQASALAAQALALARSGKREESRKTNLRVIEMYAASRDFAVTRDVRRAINNLTSDLNFLGEPKEAIKYSEKFIPELEAATDRYAHASLLIALYNRACSLSLLGDIDGAIAYLRKWNQAKGSFDCIMVKNDNEFDSIRADSRFVALIAEMGCPPDPRSA